VGAGTSLKLGDIGEVQAREMHRGSPTIPPISFSPPPVPAEIHPYSQSACQKILIYPSALCQSTNTYRW